MDEVLEKIGFFSTKLDNQARTMAQLHRKFHTLAEQQKLVRRNFVKTQKKYLQSLIDLQVALQEQGGVTEKQQDLAEDILERIAAAQKTIQSWSLISQTRD